MGGRVQHIDNDNRPDIAVRVVKVRLEGLAQSKGFPVCAITEVTARLIKVIQLDRCINVLSIAAHEVYRRCADIDGNGARLSDRLEDGVFQRAVCTVKIGGCQGYYLLLQIFVKRFYVPHDRIIKRELYPREPERIEVITAIHLLPRAKVHA